jgi:hypothetical protein
MTVALVGLTKLTSGQDPNDHQQQLDQEFVVHVFSFLASDACWLIER